MKYPKIREIVEATRALVKGPYTSSFPVEPHVPYPSFRGQPKFDAAHCLGCLACEQICPAGAIGHEDRLDAPGGPVRVMIHFTDSCIFCGECQAACIADHRGIQLSREWELSFFDRGEAFETIEKPLQLCERCGQVIGCQDHLAWVADRMGARAYGSPTLYLSRLRQLGLAEGGSPTVSKDGPRADRFKILCALCRRETTVSREQI